MGNLNDKIEALLRGGAQGATAGWGDEGVASLLGAMPTPDDKTGIPREYAAGSPEADYRNTERFANSEAERKFPGTFHAGKALGAAPIMMAAGTGAGVAGAGLMGGARGALAGAGNATEGNRTQGAARLAAPEALASMFGAAAPAALGKAKELFQGGGGPPTGGLAPAYAGAGASVGSGAAQEGLPFINMMSTTPARAGGGPRPVRLSPDERIIKSDQEDWAQRNPEAAAQAPNVGKPVMRPPAPATADEAYVPDIPKQPKAWSQSMDRTFDDIAHADNAYAKKAGEVGEQLKVREGLREGGVLPKLRNLADPREQPVRNDPTWQEMEREISKQNLPPPGRDNKVYMPKNGKLPDLDKENALAEEHAALQEGIDAIKKRNKKPVSAPREDDVRTLLGTMPL